MRWPFFHTTPVIHDNPDIVKMWNGLGEELMFLQWCCPFFEELQDTET
jgi:hypothetical protein